MIYDEYNAYIRYYMRRRRGKEYLNGLENEAIKRACTIKELTSILLCIIVRDNLFNAILDD